MAPFSPKFIGALALAACAAFASSSRAEAQIVDFQVGAAGSCSFVSTCFSNGFQFDFGGGTVWGINDDGDFSFNRLSDASSGVLGAYGGFFGPVTVTMSKAGGGTFGVSSFLAAVGDMFSLGFSSTDVTGFFSSGGTITKSIVLMPDFASYSLTGFDNLTSIEFVNADPAAFSGTVGIGLDDIATTSTPEPASLALVGTGLIVLGAVARRRRRK